MLTPVYDIEKSYQHNYEQGPFFSEEFPQLPTRFYKTKFLDHNLYSLLGIAAGPLLNSKWIELYGKLGFDILTYKTVRSQATPAHPAPNCVYLQAPFQLTTKDIRSDISEKFDIPTYTTDITITNSFGMPSPAPESWMPDIDTANKVISNGQVVVVSITGTPNLEQRPLVEDYAYTAAMAQEAGARIIEANYSCPNVASGEGAIYCDPEFSAEISKHIRHSLRPDMPLMIKLGYLPYAQLKEVVKANLPYVNAFAGINTIPMNIKDAQGQPRLPGPNRLKSGVCGNAIRTLSEEFTSNIFKIREELGADFEICGVGGCMLPDDILHRQSIGADIVMVATAAMWNPFLAAQLHKR